MGADEEAWADPRTLEPFIALTRDHGCRLVPNILPRHMEPERLRRRAGALYEAGFENLFFWDCAGPGGRANFDAQWNVLRRLGHVDVIRAWVEAGAPGLAPARTELRSAGGWDMTWIRPG